MKCMKGKLLKKLKTIKTIGYLKPDRILHVSAADGFVETFWPKSNTKSPTHLSTKEEHPNIINNDVTIQEHEIIDVTDLMKDLEEEEEEDDEEEEEDEEINDKENMKPKDKHPVGEKENLSSTKPKNGIKHSPLSEIDISSFRPPDLDSGTLFDPNLLAAFEQAVMEVKALEAERRAQIEEQELPLKFRKTEDFNNPPSSPLLDFKEKCPPGGCDSVILYTTGLRGVRKTFEDCTRIRNLLDGIRVLYYERDMSMHSGFREELWEIMGEKVIPPRLFIRGRYIGGADEVLSLHEQGKLRPLFEGVPVDRSEGPCQGCAGVRFVVCFSCNGSRKVVGEDDDEAMQCEGCNENGLIICPICC